MEDLIDSLRRIVSRWVDTVTPIVGSVTPGTYDLEVYSSKRFAVGDQVMIEGATEGEPDLVIEEVVDDTHVRLSTSVYNDWSSSGNINLRKLINNQYVQGIYIGNPEVIPLYPAITVNGTAIDSEWITLGSTKETFNIELAVHVPASTQEDGYRFLLRMIKVIREGLKQNFYPLVNDYYITAITASVSPGDQVIQVADSSVFKTNLTDDTSNYPWVSDARAILENQWISEETRVQSILGPHAVKIAPMTCNNYLYSSSDPSQNPIVIAPQRFIYNSWPSSTSIGKTSKGGTLLQSAVINWFAWEEVPFNFTNQDPHLK